MTNKNSTTIKIKQKTSSVKWRPEEPLPLFYFLIETYSHNIEHLLCVISFPGGASGREPACQCRRCDSCVQSLVWEDPLEEIMTTHSSFLTWSIPWTEEPGRLQPIRSPCVLSLCYIFNIHIWGMHFLLVRNLHLIGQSSMWTNN